MDKNTTATMAQWQPPQSTLKANKTVHAAHNKPLTQKQRKLISHIVNDGMTATDAYIQAYNTKGNKNTVYAEASKTTSKPQVKLELSKYSDSMKLGVIELADISLKYARLGGKDGASYASVAEKTLNSVIDRVDGKAKQVTEVTSRAVVLNIDLTGTVALDVNPQI